MIARWRAVVRVGGRIRRIVNVHVGAGIGINRLIWFATVRVLLHDRLTRFTTSLIVNFALVHIQQQGGRVVPLGAVLLHQVDGADRGKLLIGAAASAVLVPRDQEGIPASDDGREPLQGKTKPDAIHTLKGGPVRPI